MVCHSLSIAVDLYKGPDVPMVQIWVVYSENNRMHCTASPCGKEM